MSGSIRQEPGLIKVCEAMGADLTLLNENHGNAEPTADLLVRTSSLKACTIEGDIIPTLIDELPTIAMMACFAEGTTVIRDAAELKVKEPTGSPSWSKTCVRWALMSKRRKTA